MTAAHCHTFKLIYGLFIYNVSVAFVKNTI